MALAMRGASSGFAMRIVYQPTWPLTLIGYALFEVFPLEPELGLVVFRFGAVVNAVDIELERRFLQPIDGCLDGNAIADLPAEALHGVRAHNRALAVFQKRIPLIVGNNQLRENLPLVFRVDHKLREKVLGILIHAAEPVIVRDVVDARDAQDFIPVGQRNGVDDGGAIDRDEAIRAHHVGSAAERVVHHSEQRKQKQSHCEGTDGQDRAGPSCETDWPESVC